MKHRVYEMVQVNRKHLMAGSLVLLGLIVLFIVGMIGIHSSAASGDYKVTFDAVGGSFPNGSDQMEVESYYFSGSDPYGTSIEFDAPVPTWEGGDCYFEGWYTSKDYDEGSYVENIHAYDFQKDTTFYAKWGKHPYAYFDYTGGHYTDSDGQKQTYEEIFYEDGPNYLRSEPHEPVWKDNSKVFGGWYTSPDYSDESYASINDIMSGGAIGYNTYYANWAEPITVTWDFQEGSNQDGQSKEQWTWAKKRPLMLPPAYSVKAPSEKYEFCGWYLNPKFTGDPVYEGIKLDKDTTLYAKWDEKVVVTYDFNGGKSSQNNAAVEKEKVTKSEDTYIWCGFGESPKPNQVISGWYDNKEFKGLPYSNDYGSFEEDTTLYAKWADAWTVTVNMGEGSAPYATTKQLVEKGESTYIEVDYLEENPLSNGKMFAGFYTGPDGTGTPVEVYTNTEPEPTMGGESKWYINRFEFTPTQDTTLYAYWANPISIKYDANGGELSMGGEGSSKTVKTLPGAKPYGPAYASRQGYAFLGWSTTKDGKNILEYEDSLKNSTTLYAAWGEGYAITYDANGGSYWDNNTKQIYTVGKEEAVQWNYPYVDKAPQENLVFAGWYYDKDCTKEVENIYALVPNQNLTLYAGWSKGIKLTFDANGGHFLDGLEGDPYSSKNVFVVKGSTHDYDYGPEEAPTGKMFEGWYADKQFSNRVDAETAFVEDTTLYAHWVTPVILTFDPNGGTLWGEEKPTTLTVLPNEAIEYEDYSYYSPEREGKSFAGWYYDKEGTKPFNPNHESFLLRENTVIYAKWNDEIDSEGTLRIRYYVGNRKVGDIKTEVDSSGIKEEYYVHYQIEDYYLKNLKLDSKKQGIATTWYLDKELTRPFTSDYNDSDSVKVYGEIIDRYAINFVAPDAEVFFHRSDYDDDHYYADAGTKLSEVLSSIDINYNKPGKIHTGWSATKDGKDTVDENTSITNDITLYDIANQAYVVTLEPNGGFWEDGKGDTSHLLIFNVSPGDTLSKGVGIDYWNNIYRLESDPIHYGDKLFKGWYEDKALTKPVPNLLEYVPTSDTTLYAKWERYGEVAPTPTEPTTKPTEPTTKPSEPTTNPTEPTTKPTEKPTEPTTKTDGGKASVVLNGLVKGSDGKWAMYKANQVQTSYNGLAKNENGWYDVKNGYVAWDYTGFDKNLDTGIWWRVKNGRVDFTADGIYKKPENGIWYKTTGGKVTFNETGVFKNENGWWRVKDSRVDFNANGIYKNKNGWWKTTNGKVTFKENGVFKNENGWWKVENSKVNFNFTGIASNKNGTWYLKGGKVDFSKNGKVTYNGKTYTVKNGKVQ